MSHLYGMSLDELHIKMKTFESTCSFRQDLYVNFFSDVEMENFYFYLRNLSFLPASEEIWDLCYSGVF